MRNSPCPQLPSATGKGPSGDTGIAVFSYITPVSKTIHSDKVLSTPVCFLHQETAWCAAQSPGVQKFKGMEQALASLENRMALPLAC